MRALGFFEALSATPSDSPQWSQLAAGLGVMRLVGDALSHRGIDERSLQAALESLSRVSNLMAYAQLRAIIDATRPQNQVDQNWREVLGARLMTYGVWLHSQGHFLPAAAVMRTIAEMPAVDVELRLQAHLRRAWSLRLMKQLDEAESAYVQLESLAGETGSRRMLLEAELGFAKLTMDRGDMPGAEPRIERVISAARQAGERGVLAKALIDAARLAGTRGNPTAVIERSYEALPMIEERTDRDRTLRNISIALRELGRTEAAWHVALHVARSAIDADQRIASTILLYNLSIDGRQDILARQYRVSLSLEKDMNPTLAAEFYRAVSRDLATRGQFTAAAGEARKMLAVAEANQMSELIVKADQALADLGKGVVPALYDYRPTPVSKAAARTLAPIEEALFALV